MIPNLEEWKNWSTLERVSYVAQFATAGAFLASSIFSFLTWYEASRARKEQREFFNAEKSPSLDLSYEEANGSAKDHRFSLEIRLINNGISPARISDITSYRYGLSSSPIRITTHNESCSNVILEKGRSTKCYIFFDKVPILPAVINKSTVALYSNEFRPPLEPNSMFASLVLTYSGLFADQHTLQYTVVIQREKAPDDTPESSKQ